MFLAEKLNGKSQKSKEEILKQAGFSSWMITLSLNRI
jgi:hypothetical protein